MQKVLVSSSHFDSLCKDAQKLFEENGIGVIYDSKRKYPSYSTEEIEALEEKEEIAACLIGMDDYRDEQKYKVLPNLKAVAKFGVGVDNIDGELAARYGVAALNAPGQNSNAVAELTVGLMLDILREVIPQHREMLNSNWPRFIGEEIMGKTVGLLGFGAIARLAAEKLSGFGVKILACDIYPNYDEAKRLGVEITDQETVISESDIVSIHIPPSPETYHLFNAETFSKMKKGAYLINAARGALVDLDDLAAALNAGMIKGAALDAFEVEPLPPESAILKCRNVVLLPHTGAETAESYYRVAMTTAQDIVRVLKGEKPVHCVNGF